MELIFTDREKFLFKLALDRTAFHYIRACTYICADGYAKAENHLEISKHIVEFFTLRPFNRRTDFEAQMYVHDELQDLTDYLDERIGLPLNKPIYGDAWQPFVDKFLDEVIGFFPRLKDQIEKLTAKPAA